MNEPRRLHFDTVTPAQAARLGSTLWSSERPVVATASVQGQALLRGAFEAHEAHDWPSYRRVSGGRSVRLTDGAVLLVVALPTVDALVADVTAGNLLNRMLRPLLKALTAEGALAHYFGRDWVSVAKRPAVMTSFAHERATGRTVIEAFLGTTSGVAPVPSHPAYLGKPPGSLEELVGRRFVAHELARRLGDRFLAALSMPVIDHDEDFELDDALTLVADPPWTVTVEEAIGRLGACRTETGEIRLGGELMVSRDALSGLEGWLAEARDVDEVREAVRTCLGVEGTALFGVRDLEALVSLVVPLLQP